MKKSSRRKHWNSAYENPRFREVHARTRSVKAARMAASDIDPTMTIPLYDDSGYTLVLRTPTRDQANAANELSREKKFRRLTLGWTEDADMLIVFESENAAFLFRMHYKGACEPLN